MKRWQIILGIFLILMGVFALVETMFQINLWRYAWPLILIGLGLMIIFRHRMVGQDVQVEVPFLGEIRKTGVWEATHHEFWWFVGTNRLDFTEAVFPNGDATIRIFSFVADVILILPEDVGLRANSISFVSELKGPDGKEERIFSSLDYQSPNYDLAENKIDLQTIGFVTEIKVKRPLI